jgi:class 3 adenylate cyclase/tetratricopeptide (TPR) repeat protein
MLCLQCHSENPVTSRFCSTCGSRLEVICPQCGQTGLSDSTFCSWCGISLQAAADQPSAGGERKQATILFADIVDSTRLIADLDAEEALSRLRPVLAAIAEAVRRFNGVVVRSLGDGLKAAFGAPRALEGHALFACKAALAMQEAVTALPSAPKIRVGVHSGEVVAGELDVGAAVQREAVGLTVHLASRIEQIAEPGGIFISRSCFQLVRTFCDTAELGMRFIKGEARIEVYRLIGLKPAVASEQFRDARLTRFLGRAGELAVLQAALTAAERGESGVIGISAPPGMGKSRLCYEFSKSCLFRNIRVLEARASIYARESPMQAVLEMMRSFLRLSPLDAADTARQKIAERLLRLDQTFEADLPLINDFLGVGDPARSFPPMDPRTRHARLRNVVSRMARSSGRDLSVVIIEDLHWLDTASGDFVETLVDAVQGTRTLLIVNFRPAFRASWMTRAYYRELPLPELSASDTQGLVDDLIGNAPELRAIGQQVARRSGGNPFFAEELVMSLAESGRLVGEPGHYNRGTLSEETRLPPTVEAVIGARIDRLTETEKNLLQIGATIGKEFPLDVLREVAAVREDLVETVLARLCDAGLVREHMTIAGRGWAFRHPLIQEVAYAMQLRARRTVLHAAVAEAIERRDWGSLDEYAALLAHHWEAAGKPLTASEHLERAAAWLGKTNVTEAIKQRKKVRWLLRDEPRTETNERLRAMASSRVLNFGWRVGMTAEEAAPYADEVVNYVREFKDGVLGPMSLSAVGRIRASAGAADEWVALTREAIAMASPNIGLPRIIGLQALLCHGCMMAGLLNEGLVASEAALAAIAEHRRSNPHGIVGLTAGLQADMNFERYSSCLRTRLLIWLGRFEEAQTSISALEADTQTPDQPFPDYLLHLANVEMAWCRRGAEPSHSHGRLAQIHAARITQYADRTQTAYLRVAALNTNGLAQKVAGESEKSIDLFREALAVARREQSGLEFEPQLLADLAEVLFHAGRAKEAAEVAEQAIARARERTHRLAELHASMIRATALVVVVGRGALVEAQELLAQAEHLLQVTGAVALEPLLRKSRLAIESAGQ